MDIREKLQDPVLRDELLEDLVDLLYNLKENDFQSVLRLIPAFLLHLHHHQHHQHRRLSCHQVAYLSQ
ncbi:hypothetical protein OUZ56_018227 [Daphnia magna]|uniref:Uncharacterized protein n=1 Tax=Daphnia magna TaxID=35525 RepID=A0ABQ9Z8Z5_9CRUS|nr:hypothetical protein OUZ56_018227 [Daphnia magna]